MSDMIPTGQCRNGATGHDVSVLPLLSLQGVSVTYEDGNRRALNGIDFSIRPGETVLLVGPSGCGKSTLVSLCAGLIPDAIEARVEGEVVKDSSLTSPGGIGMVFQDPETQFCMLQARDELAFGLENRQMPRAEMPRHMIQALERVRFVPQPDKIHREMSGGQKQKLAIAAALTMQPRLLVLDEPTSNLDPAATTTVMDEIRNLRASGQTMLIVEHKFQALLDVVDRVVLLAEDGTVAASGTPEEVIALRGDWLVQHGVVLPWAANRDEPAPEPTPSGTTETESGPALAVQAGTARYGHKVVLQDINVSIPAGSFTAVVGPNGAGKSTLLQVMAGLTNLASGSAYVLGHRIGKGRRMSQARNFVSYCFQNPELQFIYERVADEMANQRLAGDVPQAIQNELNAFGLAGTAHQSPFALSQGQKRRLSVAVMLHEQRDVYMLDEPTYGQDPKTQAAILDVLCDRQQEGNTIVITTHDMDLVRRFATHVVVLADDRALFQGRPCELWQHPEVLRRAHLDGEPESPDPVETTTHDAWRTLPKQAVHKPVDALNPTLLVLTMVCAGLIGTYASHLPRAYTLLGLSVVWLMGLAWLNPWRLLKWYSPFLLVYVFYLWTFAAFTAVPPGTPTFHFLWANFSWYGLRMGLLVAVRMLSSVGYLILLLVSLDATGLIVGLCQNVRVPPKFAYGILAGMRLAPLFQSEWVQLTQARQLRGRKPRFAFLQPIQYSLPLLSLAVRYSERLAIAMEARGLVGQAARRARARTYLRVVPVRWWDWVTFAAINGAVICVMCFVHQG
jgi:energy-coupling factor transport system permease/ATP-binding protein